PGLARNSGLLLWENPRRNLVSNVTGQGHGDPGTGKSVALRLLAARLAKQRDVVVGTIDHPQSRVSDFYRELGDIFGISLGAHNRWGGFKALRERWSEHITTSMTRPVLVIDEAQEMLSTVLNELRILSSKQFDS